MDKYVHLKSVSSINHLKYITKHNDEKSGQFFSEPSSLDSTPKSVKNSKLEPMEQALLAKKVADVKTPEKKHRKPSAAGSSSRVFHIPQKTFLSTMDDETTPIEDKKSKKSKFANSLIDTIENSKQFKESFTDQLSRYYQGSQTTKASYKAEPLSAGIVLQQLTEEEKGKSLEIKLQMSRNNSLPSYKIPRKKVSDRGLVINQARPEEVTSDNEYNLKTQNVRHDVCATLPYRYLIFGLQIELEVFKKYLVMIHKGLSYATKNLKSPSEKFIRSKQVTLPEPIIKKSKLLLLDLDETLIHSCMLRNNPDVILSYQSTGTDPLRQLPVKIRPYLKEFLARVSSVYEIVIFTASASNYARTIVNYIDKDKKYINAILSRENCMETKNGFYIKDLRIIKNRDMKDLIIVDNLVHSFGFQLENGVPILEFFDDKKDEELKHLADYLMEASSYDDLREFNKERLKLHEIANKKIEDIFQKFAGF